jgi:Tfp pilus assembly protein PilF
MQLCKDKCSRGTKYVRMPSFYLQRTPRMNRIEKLKEMLAAEPGDSFIQHALGLEYCKAGDDETARGYFQQLLEVNPSYVGTYYHLAKLLERIGDEQGAIQVYEKGMEVAKAAGDQHSLGELRGAWEELTM